ncbi:MAG TPA: hypothetical protein VFI06_01685, partial [Chitinophagaceae bacterium]|nr:hypothetical protein [Chitinophagaceae bacterium]
QRDKTIETRNHILQSKYYTIFGEMPVQDEEYRHEPSPLRDSLMSRPLPLQLGAESEMDEFINQIIDRRSRLETVAGNYYRWSNKVAIKIIQILSKEYHLE